MEKWLGAALDYIPFWLEYQMRRTEQPGCAIAIVHNGRVVLERAYGYADQSTGTLLTPRHRFRVASHSKSFTAAGIMKLREAGKLRLDDAVGHYVKNLHPRIARTTITQILSHSAGIVRDSADSAFWQDREPFPDHDKVRAILAEPPTIEANTRFKYSNFGYALAGLVIEAVTNEPYKTWIAREIVKPVDLMETAPDMPLPKGARLASGHSAKLPLGHRVIFPGDQSTEALASATGFVSTARDLARFFDQLSPNAKRSVLSVASRREMTRPQWRNPHLSIERHYGLGTISGKLEGWDWFGHSGGFQGYITRTACVPAAGLTISVLTNAVDGLSHFWLDGALHILQRFAKNGAPSRKTADWTGRWWTVWGAVDLVPMSSKVLVATPEWFMPLLDASELAVTTRDRGRVALAAGFANHGEPARLVRNKRGKVSEVWLGGGRLVPEAKFVHEIGARYDKRRRPRPSR